MKKDKCSGCDKDFYNTDKKKCWSLKTAKIVWRKKISIDQDPPWNQPYQKYPDCYSQQRYFFKDKGGGE